DRLHGAQHVARVGQGDQPGLRGDRGDYRVRLDGAAGVGRQAGQGDPAGLGHRHQRPRHAVVFQVGGDDVGGVVQHALERHVQGVGAVEGEDEPVGAAAVEEPVEPVAGVVEGVLGGQGHLVPGPAGVGQRVPGEVVEGGVYALGLRETGGRVIEV